MARRPPLPEIGAGQPDSTLRFLEHVTKRDTFHRIERMSVWERARLYVLYNKQWLQPDHSWGDSNRTPFWQPLRAPRGKFFPMPVFNALVEPIQNEVARLLQAGYQYDVWPTKAEPRVQRAADLAEDVLKSKLEELNWPMIEQEGTGQLVLFGTWILKTGWETDYTKTVKLPVDNAVRCTSAGCSFKLASPKVPKAKALEVATNPRNMGRVATTVIGPNPNNPLVPQPMEATVTGCLTCADGPPLAPFTPSKDEVYELDHFGRSLGQEVPLGDVFMRNVTPYDFFPENDGMVPLWNQREWAEERIVPVEWVQEHHANGHLVEPENVQEILRWHPIVSTVHGWNDPNAWDHHCVLREYHRKPQRVLTDESKERERDTGEITIDRGRSVVGAGHHIMLDDHYMVESQQNPGVYLPRVSYHVMPWEIREGEVFGLGAAELGMPMQDTINTRLSQVQYVRHVFGNPKVTAPEGSQLYQAGYEDTGYAGDVLYYMSDVGGRPPTVIQGTQLSLNWLEEHNTDTNGIARAIGTHEVEVGAPPGKDVTAAMAIMHLTRQAGTRRQPRVERLGTQKGKAGTHLLEWIHEAYREERMYRLVDTKRLAVRSFQGKDLLAQTQVKVTVRPVHDTPEFRQQTLMDLFDKGIIQPTTAIDKRRFAKESGAPLDVILAEPNRQVELAEDEWVSFFLERKMPVVRLRGDSHLIHGQQHQLDWISDDCERWKEEVGWYQAELALEEWQMKWAMMEGLRMRLELAPPDAGPAAPPPNPITGEITATDIHKSVERWQQDTKAQQQLKRAPQSLELRLYAFLGGMVEKSLWPVGVPPEEHDRADAIAALLRFYVHMEAHLLRAQAEAALAQGGAALPAAPGAPEDAMGMQPGTPGEAIAGAGAGPGAATAAGGGAPAAPA